MQKLKNGTVGADPDDDLAISLRLEVEEHHGDQFGVERTAIEKFTHGFRLCSGEDADEYSGKPPHVTVFLKLRKDGA